MARLNENQLEIDLKTKELHRYYLITGEEDFLRRNYTERILKVLGKSRADLKNDMNSDFFSGEKTSSEKIIDSAEAIPFFAEYRVILIEDSGLFNRSDEKLANYLQEICETTILIFNESKVNKSLKATKIAQKDGLLIDCSLPGEAVLKQWIYGRLNKANVKMESSVWPKLYLRAGTSMDLLANETEKLITYVGDGGEITEETIDIITGGISQEKVFDMLDALAEKNLPKVMEYYRVFLENRVEPIQLLATIQTIFRPMLYMKEMAEKGYGSAQIAKTLSLNEWVTKKSLRLARAYTIDEMKDFLFYVGKMDTATKTGRMDSRIALESIFLRYCK